jgi:3',5'-cyclic AMP phosphodiesterase CpdA
MQRRTFLSSAGVLPVVGMVPALLSGAVAPRRSLRIAHLTDIHVQPQGAAPGGLERCLQAISAMEDKPDFILTGGDSVMDIWAHSADSAALQWKVWEEIFTKECKIPVISALGNHDVRLGEKAPKGSKKNPLYGKQDSIDKLKMPGRYYSVSKGNWKFIILDSIEVHGLLGYKGRLDEEQFEWLEAELKNTSSDTYICVLSHIPIISFCPFFDGDRETGTSNWSVPGSYMHIDARRIKDLFNRYPRVKLCLSGHIHLQDKVEYLGVKYLCNGAVCGAWWGGNCQEFAPAFSIIDLFEDGSSRDEIISYRWK